MTPKAPRQATTAADRRLDLHWERDDDILSARVSDLVAGFDTIASFAIPYARLPRKLGNYAAEFPRWADVADHTPRALLTRPKLGAVAVRALILAGREAVHVRRDTVAAGEVGADAAVARMLDQLDDYSRTLLLAQVFTLDPKPHRVIAETLGVHQVSIGRNLPRARARLAELLAEPAHHEVGERADTVRRHLGPYLPADVARVELRRLGIDPSSRTAHVLLHVAGPYARRGPWLESTAVPGGGAAQAEATVNAVFSAEAAPSTDALLGALTALGIPAGVAVTYLETLALKRFGDLWVPWTGDTTANMIEAVLHVLGAPTTAEAILELTGPAAGSVENVNRVLSYDDRFVRATRRNWALRNWGMAEYVSIAHAIGQCIDARGGTASVAEVTVDLLATYPDITTTSIRTNMSTQDFVCRDGMVRRRTTADGWRKVRPLNKVRGAFRNGNNEIRLTMPVTADLLRGSGQYLHSTVATAAGVTPGQRRAFTSPHGEVTVSWKPSSTHGANIGPLLPLAAAVGATSGDTLVLAFGLGDATLDVTRLGPQDAGMPRLRKLLGRQVRTAAAALAAALDCRREDVDAVLRARGDHDVASMLDTASNHEAVT